MMALWTLIPTPARARRVRLRSVQNVLKEHRIQAEEVLQSLRAKPLTVADGVEQAATQRKLPGQKRSLRLIRISSLASFGVVGYDEIRVIGTEEFIPVHAKNRFHGRTYKYFKIYWVLFA